MEKFSNEEVEIMIDNNIDKRNVLDEEPFSYKVVKDNKVFIYWNDKQVSILRDKESDRFLTKMRDAQLIMAKITGNFKRGNEKDNKKGY